MIGSLILPARLHLDSMRRLVQCAEDQIPYIYAKASPKYGRLPAPKIAPSAHQLQPLVTSGPKHGIRMKVERRRL